MSAGRVVAAGRNARKLDTLVRLAGKAVVPVVLSGDTQKDAAALREAAGGGADIGFDMVAVRPTLARRFTSSHSMNFPIGGFLCSTIMEKITTPIAKVPNIRATIKIANRIVDMNAPIHDVRIKRDTA